MFRFLLACSLLLLITSFSYGQTGDEVIYSKGKIFYNGERVIHSGQIETILKRKPTPNMDRFLSNYRSNYAISTGFAFLSGFGIGYTAVTAIRGKEINGGIIGASAGALILAVLFDGFARKNLKMAIKAYNNAPNTISVNSEKVDFR